MLSNSKAIDEIVISQSILNQVKNCLTPQPWQPNEHKRVAKELKLPSKLVYRAIDRLIELGIFHPQKDGVVYDEEGNVLMVDEQRLDVTH